MPFSGILTAKVQTFGSLSTFVTVQYLHTYWNLPRSFPSDAWQVTSKNPFQIGFADGIFAFKPVFYYGQRSKCADLLNSYKAA